MSSFNKNVLILVVGLLAAFLIGLFVSPAEPPVPAKDAVISGWHFGASPMNTPIIGLWEQVGHPGHFDPFEVVRTGEEWIADAPDGERAVMLKNTPPTCWKTLP